MPTATEDNASLYCYKAWNQNVEKYNFYETKTAVVVVSAAITFFKKLSVFKS
jgi:hypothetical protein